MADPWREWMEKQISNLQTMVQGAKMLAENSKEVTKINRRLPKEEKIMGKILPQELVTSHIIET
jgi:hypothetical protein